MITYIKGKVIHSGVQDKVGFVDLLLESGVAYRILVQPGNLTNEDEMELFTYFKVREDAQELYGFKDKKSRNFFEKLISVSGIGPKTGLAVLSTYTDSKVKQLIEEGDYKSLSKVPGIGNKSAKKIIVELQGKIDLSAKSGEGESALIKELKEALRTLGFSGGALDDMVENGKKKIKKDPDIEIEALVSSVLKGN